MRREDEEEKNAAKFAKESGPKLDLGFKEGQTIKININVSKSGLKVFLPGDGAPSWRSSIRVIFEFIFYVMTEIQIFFVRPVILRFSDHNGVNFL